MSEPDMVNVFLCIGRVVSMLLLPVIQLEIFGSSSISNFQFPTFLPHTKKKTSTCTTWTYEVPHSRNVDRRQAVFVSEDILIDHSRT